MPVRSMAIILLLAVSLIYGLYYLAIEALLESGWQSHWMNSTRFLLGGAVLALVALACRQGPELVRLHRQELPRILLISWGGVGMATALLTLGQQFVDSSVAGTLGALIPIATVLLGSCAFFGSERIRLRAWLGIFLGSSGVILIAAPWGGAVNPIGVLAVVIAAFLFALEAQWIGKWFAASSPLALTAAVTVWAGIGFTVLALSEPFQSGNWPLLILLSMASNVLAYGLFLALIARSGAVFANLNNYLIAVVAVLAGVFIAGDQLTLQLAIAGACCLIGAVLAGSARSDKA